MKTKRQVERELIDEICQMASRIKLEQKINETIVVSDFEEKVRAYARRISELSEKLTELKKTI